MHSLLYSIYWLVRFLILFRVDVANSIFYKAIFVTMLQKDEQLTILLDWQKKDGNDDYIAYNLNGYSFI